MPILYPDPWIETGLELKGLFYLEIKKKKIRKRSGLDDLPLSVRFITLKQAS